MLSRAVASVFFEEQRPQKLPIHGLYAGVARDSCLPCKRAARRAAACRAPVALLVASRVNVPLVIRFHLRFYFIYDYPIKWFTVIWPAVPFTNMD